MSILAEIIQEKNQTFGTSISDELLRTKEQGVLCVIAERTGSAPRGVGSMMPVIEEGQ